MQKVFAIKIKSYYLPISENSEYDLNERYRRQLSWLKSVINRENLSLFFEFRIISVPQQKNNLGEKISLFLVVRAEDMDNSNFQSYCNDIFNITAFSFPEYDFEIVDNKNLQQILNPFNINHLYEIRRTIENINLDTLVRLRNKNIGFNLRCDGYSKDISTSEILHVSPFTIKVNPANTFYKLLQSSSSNYIFSIVLQQFSPNNELVNFINNQILICERFSQLSVSTSSDTDKLFPALREKAKFYESFQNYLLTSLKETPNLIKILIGSNNVLHHVIINNFISYIAGENTSITINKRTDDFLFSHCINFETVKVENDFSLNEIHSETKAQIYGRELSANIRFLLSHAIGMKEGASVFSFPYLIHENIQGIKIKRSKYLPAFENSSAEGVDIGVNIFSNKETHIKLSDEDRRRHTYIVGQTGTGKTNLLKNMILSDIKHGKGLCVIDPHGDLFNELLNSIPDKRINDVVIIDPTDTDYPVIINLLDYKSEAQRYFITQEMVNILKTLMIDEFGSTSISNYSGPIFFQHVKMNLLLVMSDPDKLSSLFDFYNIFQIENYWKNWLPLKISDQHLENWVNSVLPNTDYLRQGSEGASLGAYINSKFEQFLFDPLLRNIFSGKQSTIDFREVMDSSKILLVNLAKGQMSQINSRFLGLVILAKLQSEALQRIRLGKSLRKDFFVYIDEFQSITTENFITLLSEGRKFGINLILANQFISQIPEHLQKAIFGNVGTIISFRSGFEDAVLLEKRFSPYLSGTDFINLPNWSAYVSALSNGAPVPPFSINTYFFPAHNRYDTVEKIYYNSRRKYSVKI